MALDWTKLLSTKRRSHLPEHSHPKEVADTVEFREELERDYDRILFSTPVRRLADKTQVFPLERNDSVRNRLTHSYEVSNLARSMGTYLAYSFDPIKSIPNAARRIPSLLAAAGLAHDLGNPPFGHQGESAIQAWFDRKKPDIFDSSKQNSTEKEEDVAKITLAMKEDFLRFEGNAQTIRLLARLQSLDNDRGLNLTAATLAAIMKYPTPSDKTDKNKAAQKKHGYFQSEADIVKLVQEETGLGAGIRHPLTYLMEACDDIAYLVLDAEDAVKKELVSFHDLVASLDSALHDSSNAPELIQQVLKEAKTQYAKLRSLKLTPSELNDVSMQKFRVNAISLMVNAALDAFKNNYQDIIEARFESDLIKVSVARDLAKTLKQFDKAHAYQSRAVLALELEGYNTLQRLMGMLWKGITERKVFSEPASERTSPFASYAYGRISENYRRVFEQSNHLPIRYREAQLLTDMVSGMTDTFVINLTAELEKYHDTRC